MYVNGNGPIPIPSGNYNNREHTFQIPINPTCLIEGENSFRFTHVSDQGYEVRELCIGGLLTGTPSVPSPPISTSPARPDTTPPTGTIIINKGDETTNCQIVTLYFSAEDHGSGMGEGAQMMISKHDREEWSEPMPFEPVKTWTISPGKGLEKKLYMLNFVMQQETGWKNR